MEISGFWLVALLAVAGLCIAQAVRDLRKRHYAWAMASAVAAAIILSMPVQSHVVKIDLPASR